MFEQIPVVQLSSGIAAVIIIILGKNMSNEAKQFCTVSEQTKYILKWLKI